jgi:hypothetical protein
MALTKVKNSNLDDADLVALAGNDGSNLTGVLKTGDIGSTVQAYDANIATTSDITTAVSGAVSGLTSDIATAVSGLVDSAPGTLDTLNELAAALGDDENHATAMTTLINAKLSPDGDGSQLVNLPASGGVVEAVASGALANGDKVILKPDGTVGIISNPFTLVDPPIFGSENIFNEGSTEYIVTEIDPNNSSKFVVAYRDQGNSDVGTAIVGTITGTTIAFGSEYVFNSASTYFPAISFDPNNSGKFVIAYKDSGNLNYGTAIVGTITGTTIAFGSEYVFNAGHANASTISFDPINSDKFVITYTDGSNSNYGTAIVGTVTGTTIAFGSEYVFNGNVAVWQPAISFDPNNSGKFVIAYTDATASNNVGTAIVGTITGTTIAFGSKYVFNNAATTGCLLSFDPNNSDKLVIAYRDQGNSSYGTAIVGTVTGTTIAFGSKYVFNNANSLTGTGHGGVLSFDPNNSGKFGIAYKDIGNSGYGTAIIGTVSGTTITYGSKYVFNSATTEFMRLHFDPINTGKFIIVYQGYAQKGKVVVGTISPAVTNLTADNFLGISDDAYADTTTATIQVVGSTDDAQSGLTTGSKHYVRNDGSLSTTPDDPVVYAGMALSSTKLIIKELDPSQLAAAAATGGLVHLSTVVASDVATADIDSTFNSTYSKYVIEATDVRVSDSGGKNIRVERKINSVYANYSYIQNEHQNGTWANKTPDITAPLNNAPSQRGASFTMTVYDPANALSVNSGTIFGVAYSGYDTSVPTVINNFLLEHGAAALTGIRFKASSGNISGTFRLYGISTS